MSGNAKGLRETKVGECDVTIVVDEDVRGFDVAMHDPTVMQILDCNNLQVTSQRMNKERKV